MREVKADAKTIFLEALDCNQSDQLMRFLEEACGSDAALRTRVEELLRAHREAGAFLGGAEKQDGARDQPMAERPGTVIGPYKLLEQIGEGGMGVVWMAEQTQPVQRKVALKVIKPGMDSRQVIARFEAERQALAMMDHVNIARVFDGGATASGRPYFVMEVVHGVAITKYCDDNRLTPRQRLELFVPVCQAIQHAHQKGIIHRDIKPSNVMITHYDGKPVPKVIDFGVAKATEQRLTDRTLFTQYGTMVGTFEYMSPEQAEMSALGVDTRSDIFSLGVLLYQLLTGSTPLSHERLKEAAFAEVLRMIKEEEPTKPSARLSDLGKSGEPSRTGGDPGTDRLAGATSSLASVAAQRHMEPAKLTKLVRGELDWIVMKTLEKDRNRRYETASGLAMDVQRYLNDEPVQACPPSAGYRLRKFARRHKGPLLAASLVVLALVGGIIGTTLGLIEASEQRDAATAAGVAATAAGNAEKLANEEAQTQEAEIKAVLDFVENKIFAAARPKDQAGGLGYDVQLRDALKAALPFVDKSFPKQPLIEARLRLTLGLSFHYLGDAKIAAEQFQAARTLYTQHRGPDHPDTLLSMHMLASSYDALGRHADALKLHAETLAIRKAKLGTDHRDTLASMTCLASNYYALGRHPDALKLREEATRLKDKLGPDHPDTLASIQNLAISYDDHGRYADARKLREESLALLKDKLGPNHPDTLLSMHNLASSFNDLGRYADALKLCEEVLVLQKDKLGPEHAQTLMSMLNLAYSYAGLGRRSDALKLREVTLALQKTRLGSDHPHTLVSMRDLASSYAALGRHADALRLGEETLALCKAKLGPDHPQTLGSMHSLALSYFNIGRHADAVKLGEETLALEKVKLGPDHRNTVQSMGNLVISYTVLGRYAEALKVQEKTLALEKAKLGPDHPDTLGSMSNLAILYAALGRHADAVRLGEETLARRIATQGPDHPDTLAHMANLAWPLAFCPDPKLRDPRRAVELAKKAVKLPPHVANAWTTLGLAHYSAGDWKAARTALEQGMKLHKGGDSRDWFLLAMTHWKLGDKEEAGKWYQQAVEGMESKPLSGPDLDIECRPLRAEAALLVQLAAPPKRVNVPEEGKKSRSSRGGQVERPDSE